MAFFFHLGTYVVAIFIKKLGHREGMRERTYHCIYMYNVYDIY